MNLIGLVQGYLVTMLGSVHRRRGSRKVGDYKQSGRAQRVDTHTLNRNTFHCTRYIR